MAPNHMPDLSRRERQIMEIIYARGRASAAEVRESLPDAPSDSAVRTMLRLLEEKGHLRHKKEGRRFVFSPVVDVKTARRSALKRLVTTFFDGSVEQAVASLLDIDSRRLSNSELDRLSALIDGARKEGGKS
jgi:predicted transcriptional regulator